MKISILPFDTNSFGIFNELSYTQNENAARFARNVEWDFFCDFQTPWSCCNPFLSHHHNDIFWGKIHLFTEILVHQKEKKAKRIMMCLATLATTVYLCFNASSFFVSFLARSIIKNWKGDTHKLYYSNSLKLVLKRYLENVRKYYWKHLLLRWRLRFL